MTLFPGVTPKSEVTFVNQLGTFQFVPQPWQEFRGHLRESQEYMRRCKQGKCKEADEKAVDIYREARPPEP